MSILERHMSVISAVSMCIYIAMFVSYIRLDINNGHFDLAFTLVLIVLLISLVAFAIKFVTRELSDV